VLWVLLWVLFLPALSFVFLMALPVVMPALAFVSGVFYLLSPLLVPSSRLLVLSPWLLRLLSAAGN
jgi:hypothetical protein